MTTHLHGKWDTLSQGGENLPIKRYTNKALDVPPRILDTLLVGLVLDPGQVISFSLLSNPSLFFLFSFILLFLSLLEVKGLTYLFPCCVYNLLIRLCVFRPFWLLFFLFDRRYLWILGSLSLRSATWHHPPPYYEHSWNNSVNIVQMFSKEMKLKIEAILRNKQWFLNKMGHRRRFHLKMASTFFWKSGIQLDIKEENITGKGNFKKHCEIMSNT